MDQLTTLDTQITKDIITKEDGYTRQLLLLILVYCNSYSTVDRIDLPPSNSIPYHYFACQH